MEFISVTLMLAVLTSLVLTAAPAKKDTPEMDDIVTVRTEPTIKVLLLSSPQFAKQI